MKKAVLYEYGVQGKPEGYDGEICEIIREEQKYNHHFYDGRIRGYGMVLLPKN